ncbi:MAG TPA: hypothetical protein VIA62_26540 [Thermoanaerobaculia bacterium]|jgi:hypothetical protein|nr:hypothetical protein [Thermoanaerobaculia bacterium]
MSDRETLVGAYQAGQLPEAIQAAISPDRSERAKLASVLASLHNEGRIDLFNVFGALTNKSAPSRDFFLLRHVFEELLPELEAPVAKLIRCVLHLYREAGIDLAAGTVLEAFRDFCARQADRPKAALAEIEADPETLADLLVPVLIAGSTVDPRTYVAETIRLSHGESIDLRRRALFALGRIGGEQAVWNNPDVAKTLEHVIEVEEDDQVLASSIKSAFALSRHDATNQSRWIAVVAGALTKGGEIALHAASEIFGFQTNDLSPEFLELLLANLAQVKPSNKGTLDNIDYGIAHLLRSKHAEEGLCFLESLLRSHPQEIGFSNFNDVMRAIRDHPGLLSKVATRWFLGGEAVLCEGVTFIVDAPPSASPEIEVDVGELMAGVDPVRFVFAARKAIGYLFLKPICATSFLLSLMRQAPDSGVRSELESLLLNPLLINFSGSVAEYLARRAESEEGEVKVAVRRALDALEAYLDDLKSVGNIPALHSSLEHRDAYRRHFSEEVAQSFKRAQAESVFLQLIHRSVLLYGRKAIHHVFGPEGQIKRSEMQLGSHGTEIEFPRMTRVDPHGLEFMLRVFRHERMST